MHDALCAIAPQAALRSTFGDSLEGPLAEIVVRNWGALIALVGAMLIYGAYHPSVRPLVLTVAGLSKLIFVGLVVGSQYLGHQVGLAIGVDLVMVRSTSATSSAFAAVKSRPERPVHPPDVGRFLNVR